MVVYVLSKTRHPLMPTHPAKARFLLRTGKARVVRSTPFIIQLNYGTGNGVQPLTHGVDTGSGTLGSSVADALGNVIYSAEVTVRNDISASMTQRASYRRNRRNRKTRYRKCKYTQVRNKKKNQAKGKSKATLKGPAQTRTSSKSSRRDPRVFPDRPGRISPAMVSKIDSHLKEIRFVASILPITKVVLETGTFDPHALKNPEVLTNKLRYQQGANYGYENTKAFVLDRDQYKCQHRACKSNDRRLHVHHIVFRRDHGSDEPENLITLRKTCHDDLHAGRISSHFKGKKMGRLRHATQMNSIRVQLLKRLPDAEETFGYITKANRQVYTDRKEHGLDAAFIATGGVKPTFQTNVLLRKRSVTSGDYKQTMGAHSGTAIPAGKIMGFKKFDKVRYRGAEYFIKGRFSTGYAILMDIDGNKAALKPIPKFNRMKRISARASCLI